jgi:hypothetical protein
VVGLESKRDGRSCRRAGYLIRCLGRMVSTVVCLVGYSWMLGVLERQTWHDNLANTVDPHLDRLVAAARSEQPGRAARRHRPR